MHNGYSASFVFAIRLVKSKTTKIQINTDKEGQHPKKSGSNALT